MRTPPKGAPGRLAWNERDRRAVDVARALAVDAVEQAGHGHPGTAMSLAPAAYLLFQRLLRHDPADPQSGEAVGLDGFGASAPYQALYERYGLTAERVAAAARSSVARLGGRA